MTEQQIIWITQLAGCTFLPGSYEKRFVRDMASTDADKELSEKQAAYLLKLAYHYRRQRGEPNMARPSELRKPLPPSAEDERKLQEWNEGKPL